MPGLINKTVIDIWSNMEEAPVDVLFLGNSCWLFTFLKHALFVLSFRFEGITGGVTGANNTLGLNTDGV